jgi:hypothetical protein
MSATKKKKKKEGIPISPFHLAGSKETEQRNLQARLVNAIRHYIIEARRTI